MGINSCRRIKFSLPLFEDAGRFKKGAMGGREEERERERDGKGGRVGVGRVGCRAQGRQRGREGGREGGRGGGRERSK